MSIIYIHLLCAFISYSDSYVPLPSGPSSLFTPPPPGISPTTSAYGLIRANHLPPPSRGRKK